MIAGQSAGRPSGFDFRPFRQAASGGGYVTWRILQPSPKDWVVAPFPNQVAVINGVVIPRSRVFFCKAGKPMYKAILNTLVIKSLKYLSRVV